MDYRELESHARGVYPTQYTWRMETARVKQEEETNKGIIKESSKKSGRKNVSTKDKSSKQDLTYSAKELTIELPEGRESPYHRLD